MAPRKDAVATVFMYTCGQAPGLVRLWGGILFGGPYIKDKSIVGSIFGSPYFGKLPYIFEGL